MDSILELVDVRKTFAGRRTGGAESGSVRALDGVSFRVERGECAGLVGESGCGKSTIARAICRFLDIDEGHILLDGEDISHIRGKQPGGLYSKVQMVFQNPAGSFDPRRTLAHGICERLVLEGASQAEARATADELARQCGLDPAILDRYPREVSGGQCQRAAIARALAARPELLICDEATSALDATVQRQIAELLGQLRQQHGTTMLFISHDLALVSSICDHVVVMRSGEVVEDGPTQQVVQNPSSPYTRLLLEAAL